MGKLKEKLLNNLDEQQMEDIFGISSFEYVELMSKYKDDESYVPTEAEVEDIEKMVEDYYASKEFQEYVNNDIELVLSYEEWHRNRDAMAEQFSIDEINDSLQVKFTEAEVLDAIRKWKNEDWFIGRIKDELNKIWNTKRGLF
jgi:HD superfamily phosphohydrolase YqeK